MKRVAVLGFHKVGPQPPGGWESWYYVSADTFALFLCLLRDEGWTPLGACEFVRGLNDASTLPDRSALITFDDGYRSMLDVAVPCLESFGFPAVAFVPTGFIGGANDFDKDEEPPEPICSAEDLRELDRRGVSVQSHGVTHRTFSDLRTAEILDEVTRSREQISRIVGRDVELFAYPYGDAGRSTHSDAALQEAGYAAAFLYGGGPQSLPPDDRFRITRLAMGPDTDLEAALS